MNRLEKIYDAFLNIGWNKNQYISPTNNNLYLSFFLRILNNKPNNITYQVNIDKYVANDNFIPSEENMEEIGVDNMSYIDSSIYLTVEQMYKYDRELGGKYSLDIYEISTYCSWDIYLAFSNLNWDWDWDNLSQNQHITIDIIKSNPQLPWSFNGLSCNPNLTIEYFLENIDKLWDFSNLSCHRIITLDIIKK